MQPTRSISIAAVVITGVLIALLLSQVTPDEVLQTILSLDPFYLAIGFIFYIGSYFFRSLRFHLLLNKTVSLKDLFMIVCLHSMMNNLLPARTGEVSYIYLLKKTQGRSTGEGVATLMAARISDLITISLIFLAAFLVSRFYGDTISSIAIVAFVVIALCLLALFWVMKCDKKRIQAWVHSFFVFIRYEKTPLADYILRKTEETVDCFDALGSQGVNFHLRIFVVSCVIWIGLYTFCYCMTLAMQINLGYMPVVFASSFVIFTTVLPIQGIGGFGTVEGGWVIGFMLVGLNEATAISSAFGFHICMLAYTLFLGLSGFLFLRRRGTVGVPMN